MFRLDDKFLEEVGLGAMPEDQRKPFLQHIYNELEKRVGTKLSDGMSDEQLQEFEAIIESDENTVKTWLEQNATNYQEDEVFKRLQQASGEPADSARLRSEYAATKWLEVNRPDYRQVVADTLEELKKEIANNKDSILGTNQVPA